MSEVEETIERIKVQGGVEGYVICNKQGQVLRRFPTMSLEDAEKYAQSMISLTTQARGVVRDLNPKNELRYLRVRAKRHEIMVAFGKSKISRLFDQFYQIFNLSSLSFNVGLPLVRKQID